MSPLATAKVGCVILNYNSLDATLKAARSALASTHPNLKIYLVDNPKTGAPAQAAALGQQLPQCTVIANSENLGYAGGNNAGIRRAIEDGCEYVWVLSNDTEVEPTTLSAMLEVFAREPDAGQVGSLTVYDHSTKIYFYRGDISRFGRTKNRAEKRDLREVPELTASEYGPTDFVNGASVLVKAEHLKSVGLIPEAYFLYFEDPDWSLRFRRHGLKLFVSYRAKVYHLKGLDANSVAAPARPNYVAEYYCRRNEYFFRRQNGFFVLRGHFLARLGWRYLKHAIAYGLGRRPSENRNMMYVLSQVMLSVLNGQMGRFDLQIPEPNG